jgi:hypothetical protein
LPVVLFVTVAYETVPGREPSYAAKETLPVGAIVVLAPLTVAVRVTAVPGATLEDDGCKDRFGGAKPIEKVVAAEVAGW